jgi:branched-subunit amino acid ABC-type transport system permease component
MARILGIDIDQTIRITFMIGPALGGLRQVLWSVCTMEPYGSTWGLFS